MYETIAALRAGAVIWLEGIKFIKDEGVIGPGDLYIAERNTGPHLLTCRELGVGCVHPTTLDYAFDTSECVKVREMI